MWNIVFLDEAEKDMKRLDSSLLLINIQIVVSLVRKTLLEKAALFKEAILFNIFLIFFLSSSNRRYFLSVRVNTKI